MSNWKIKSKHVFISCSSIFDSIVFAIQVSEVKTPGEQSLGAWTLECQVLITSFIESRVDVLFTQCCLHSKMLDGQFEFNASVLAVTEKKCLSHKRNSERFWRKVMNVLTCCNI